MAIPVIVLPKKKKCDHQHPTPKSWHCVLEHGHLGDHQVETKCSCPWDENHIRCPVCVDWKERQHKAMIEFMDSISRYAIDADSGASAKQKTDFRIPIPKGLLYGYTVANACVTRIVRYDHVVISERTGGCIDLTFLGTPMVISDDCMLHCDSDPGYILWDIERNGRRSRLHAAPDRTTTPAAPAVAPAPVPMPARQTVTVKPWYVACADEYRELRERKADLLAQARQLAGKHYTPMNPPALVGVGDFLTMNPFVRENPKRRRVTLRGLWAATKDVYASWATLAACCGFAYLGNHIGLQDYVIAIPIALAIDAAGSWYFEKRRQEREGA